MEIPSGWRIYTLRADNVLFGRSLSSVHTDSMMIRRLSDDSFKELGSATKATINEAEKNFIEKITSYTPNITILHHEPIIVGDLRGSLSQSTDNEDLKKSSYSMHISLIHKVKVMLSTFKQMIPSTMT